MRRKTNRLPENALGRQGNRKLSPDEYDYVNMWRANVANGNVEMANSISFALMTRGLFLNMSQNGCVRITCGDPVNLLEMIGGSDGAPPLCQNL